MYFYLLLIHSFILLSDGQYDNVIYGYNYPTSNSIDGNNLNLFSGITGDFLSAMTSALISGMGNGVTETFLPGTTPLSGVYPQQVDLNNIFSNTFYPNTLLPYQSRYINNERNTFLGGDGGNSIGGRFENLYKGAVISNPNTISNIYTLPSSYYPPTAFNGVNGPRPLGSTFGGYSNEWGKPIVPVISSKDTTAFNGKFLAALISKMGYQKGEKPIITTTTKSPSVDQQPKITSGSNETSLNDKTEKKDNLVRRKRRNIVDE